MSNPSTVDEILEFAIESEQAAADLYLSLAKQAKNPVIKKTFEDYAAEEMMHKAKLLDVQSGELLLTPSEKPVLDLKISDYTVEEEPGVDADYPTVLIYAMKKEKAAYRLYTDLAANTDVPELKELLLGLAQEEAKHKLQFELEYDENFLTEN